MHNTLIKGRYVGAVDDINIDSASDTDELVFAGPVRITRIGFIVTTAVVNAAGIVGITAKRRPVVGAASNQVTLGVHTLTGTTTRAAGAVTFLDCHIDDTNGETAEDGLLRNEAPNSNITAAITGFDPWIIPMGQSLELSVSDAADSGAGRYFVEYEQLPLTGTFTDQANIFEDVTNQ